jgi:hypothetical protein
MNQATRGHTVDEGDRSLAITVSQEEGYRETPAAAIVARE